MATKKTKTTKRDSVAALFRITQNAHSKAYRVEKNYKCETADGTFVDDWCQVRGPYDKLTHTRNVVLQEIESVKADLAKWIPV